MCPFLRWDAPYLSDAFLKAPTSSRSCGVTLDVGANIGLSTLPPAARGWQVIAFEPNANNGRPARPIPPSGLPAGRGCGSLSEGSDEGSILTLELLHTALEMGVSSSALLSPTLVTPTSHLAHPPSRRPSLPPLAHPAAPNTPFLSQSSVSSLTSPSTASTRTRTSTSSTRPSPMRPARPRSFRPRRSSLPPSPPSRAQTCSTTAARAASRSYVRRRCYGWTNTLEEPKGGRRRAEVVRHR